MPKSGSKATRAGIYECTYCGKEKTIRKGGRLPPCSCGTGNWRLVKATTKTPRKVTKRKGRKKKGGLMDFLFG